MGYIPVSIVDHLGGLDDSLTIVLGHAELDVGTPVESHALDNELYLAMEVTMRMGILRWLASSAICWLTFRPSSTVFMTTSRMMRAGSSSCTCRIPSAPSAALQT